MSANASYVHRLIQSKADGKLVELPGPETQIDEEIKEGILEVRLLLFVDLIIIIIISLISSLNVMDVVADVFVRSAVAPQSKRTAVAMEYTYLLTSQLESQRQFWEHQLQVMQMSANLNMFVEPQTLTATCVCVVCRWWRVRRARRCSIWSTS